jgi:hypothetical protein
MARRMLGEALGVIGAAARHVIWYVSYQVGGKTRDDDSGRKLRDRRG